ncbi:MAG: nickel-responsive transcriptional regulator NikR [Thermoplasmatota archaeon]|nr:nickel-responsive transcriptional regulator NikR [Candidatus Thermoplasmatota archaeon]
MTVQRVGVSFEPELLEQFDRVIAKKGYMNRSEAIRDLVRGCIADAALQHENGQVMGTLTIIYDHDEGDVTNKLLHLEHGHLAEILSTTHIHVTRHLCLEVLVIRGEASKARMLADHITALKGVKQGELVLTPLSGEPHE